MSSKGISGHFRGLICYDCLHSFRRRSFYQSPYRHVSHTYSNGACRTSQSQLRHQKGSSLVRANGKEQRWSSVMKSFWISLKSCRVKIWLLCVKSTQTSLAWLILSTSRKRWLPAKRRKWLLECRPTSATWDFRYSRNMTKYPGRRTSQRCFSPLSSRGRSKTRYLEYKNIWRCFPSTMSSLWVVNGNSGPTILHRHS